jgi:hypothetical protein
MKITLVSCHSPVPLNKHDLSQVEMNKPSKTAF